jgi:uncharacterized protein
MSPVRATLLLGFVWGLWHLAIYGPLAPLLITRLAFFYTYLYNKVDSVLLAIPHARQHYASEDNLILMPRGVHGVTNIVIFGILVAAQPIWLS